MKPAIGWGLYSAWTRHGDGFAVLTITSEKKTQIYGRNEDGEATHITKSALIHRFDTEEQAKGAHTRAAKVSGRLQPAVEAAREEYQRLDRECRREVIRAAKGETDGEPDQQELNLNRPAK